MTREELDNFYNEHCRNCGTQRCEGVYSEEWRTGCEKHKRQINSK